MITHASNDMLHTDGGAAFIDLFTGYGSTWLGHGRAEVVAALKAQVERPWLLGGLGHPGLVPALAAISRWCPAPLISAGLYSTGMEAAEFAMRVCRTVTGRRGVVGFERSMHGKSLATACLSWENGDGIGAPHLHRAAFVDSATEEQVLAQLDSFLCRGDVGAVFVEIMQGSNGALEASTPWYRAVRDRCRLHGALLVCDEILTGFHRTGPRFRFEKHGLDPDMVLIGKALGNGFPVSSVLIRSDIDLAPKMLPGSTFSGNPLACAAVLATLATLESLPIDSLVEAMHSIVSTSLDRLRAPESAAVFRGSGGLWVITLPNADLVQSAVAAIYAQGVCVGYSGRCIRILPAMTIKPHNLKRACDIVSSAVRSVVSEG